MPELEEFFERVLSVKIPEDRSCIDILDQTLLPGTVRRIELRTRDEIWNAVKRLQVRGAPAIGVCAAYGLALLASRIEEESFDAFHRALLAEKEFLASSRPTAVNLFWALDRIDAAARANRERPVGEIKRILFREADAIREEDVRISRGIGAIGFGLMERLKRPGRPVGILTHCNAGTLATAKYGTATAPVYTALERGWAPDDMHVYCDETRPLLQGARLTAFELHRSGIPTTVQCDGMASVLLASGRIDVVFVGCDRVAENGDAANKIGTAGLAVLAHHYGVPMYVCAPSSTIDMSTPTGADIPIEMRDPDEVSSMWYRERMVPEGVEIFNPAFDVADHRLLAGIITEKGLCTAPYGEAFRALGIR